jgi:hypothetical protein
VLGVEAADQAGMVILNAWLVWYVLSVIGNLSWIYALLVLYAMLSRTVILRSTAPIILNWYIGVNVLVTAGFLAEHFFLSKRYLIALSLVFMLWVPFALNDIIRKWPSERHRAILSVAAGLIVISSLGGVFDFGYSKTYVRDAGNWIAQNIPANASLYSNDIQLMYYSDHYGSQIFNQRQAFAGLQSLQGDKWKQFDYIALRLDDKDKAETASFISMLPSPPISIFKNRRGDRVAIYKISRGGAES